MYIKYGGRWAFKLFWGLEIIIEIINRNGNWVSNILRTKNTDNIIKSTSKQNSKQTEIISEKSSEILGNMQKHLHDVLVHVDKTSH